MQKFFSMLKQFTHTARCKWIALPSTEFTAQTKPAYWRLNFSYWYMQGLFTYQILPFLICRIFICRAETTYPTHWPVADDVEVPLNLLLNYSFSLSLSASALSMICPEITFRVLRPSGIVTGLPTKLALRSIMAISRLRPFLFPTRMKKSIVSPISLRVSMLKMPMWVLLAPLYSTQIPRHQFSWLCVPRLRWLIWITCVS